MIEFSADSRTVVFNTFPSKSDSDKAKKDKKAAPRDGMTIVDLASGKSVKIERVRRFAMPEDAGGYLAYQKEGPDAASAAAAETPQGNDFVDRFGDQQAGRGGRGGRGGAGGGGARPQFGTDLVLRTIADATERTFSDVVEFSLSHDGKQMVYAVSARDSSKNGVFAVNLAGGEPMALLAGKGKYLKVAWDEAQKQVAFLSDRDDQASKPAKFKLYRWDRQSSAATELASAATPGFQQQFVISDNGNLSFSKDGSRVYFGVGTPAPEKKDDAADVSTDDKAIVELWSYKDDYIQPIQKVRAARDRNRTFTAMVSIADKKVLQISDDSLETATLSENPQYALGTDTREYRREADYAAHTSDIYLVDTAAGTRKLLAKKKEGNYTWSPSGRYLLTFDGKDWSTISVPDGKSVNLTANLPVKFWKEDDDHPDTPPSYGAALWTEDGKSVLLYDHYDIWRVSPDGTGAKNITAGYGRAHEIQFRYVREDTDARERWVDGTKPLLLLATNQKTWDTGFFRASIDGGEPKQLIMGAEDINLMPVKAKNADVYLLTEQTFLEFPDLVTTNGTFKELARLATQIRSRITLLWGASEVVHFKNADGVALEGTLYKPANFDPRRSIR